MGKRYESKRGEVRNIREEGDRIKNDQETLNNEYSLLSAVDSLLSEIDDEAMDAIANVEKVGEQESARLETEHEENDTEKNKIADEIDSELEKLRSGLDSLSAVADNPFGKKSVEQAKKEYKVQSEKYRELIDELELDSQETHLDEHRGSAIDNSIGGVVDYEYSDSASNSELLTNASPQYASIATSMTSRKVSYNPITLFGRKRTSEEITNRLGGGDQTDGSCSSLAFAYAGNRAGYDVLDFRDGDSRSFFSSNNTIQMVSELPGVTSVVLHGTDDFACSHQLFDLMEEGKEYYFATGMHAAVVRKNEGNIEYLELQHPTKNGWKSMNDYELLGRFGCEHNESTTLPNFLISVDSLASSREFLSILGYINTNEHEQHKGADGYER